jgi:hypothetical protein
MAALEPDEVVARLISSGVPEFMRAQSTRSPWDGNVIRGPLPEPEEGCPVLAVSVLSSAGIDRYRFLGTAHDFLHLVVQVEVRSDNFAFSDGLRLARACRDAIHLKAAEGYITIEVKEPEPRFLQKDEANRFHWALTVELRRVT